MAASGEAVWLCQRPSGGAASQAGDRLATPLLPGFELDVREPFRREPA